MMMMMMIPVLPHKALGHVPSYEALLFLEVEEAKVAGGIPSISVGSWLIL
jgi:hypothetical protein